jgi:hypothetical protein
MTDDLPLVVVITSIFGEKKAHAQLMVSVTTLTTCQEEACEILCHAMALLGYPSTHLACFDRICFLPTSVGHLPCNQKCHLP